LIAFPAGTAGLGGTGLTAIYLNERDWFASPDPFISDRDNLL